MTGQRAAEIVNTLDDYEEGTWTPVLGATVSQTEQFHAIQTVRYAKIGNFVRATFRISFALEGSPS